MQELTPQVQPLGQGWPIEDRLNLLLKEQLAGDQSSLRKLWAWLETRTGVSAARWRNAHTGHQKVAADMIEALARLWPQYAFWLATGITDTANGHIAPLTALNFPEHSYVPDENSTRYFELSLALNSHLAERANVAALDVNVRRAYLERLHVLGRWTASGLLTAAYEISSMPEYQQLEHAWKEREKHRDTHLKLLLHRKPPVKPKNTIELNTPDQRSIHQDNFDLFYKPSTNK